MLAVRRDLAFGNALDNLANIVPHLTPDERIRLLEDLEKLIRLQEKPTPRHKMTEFEGIAEDFWKGIDAQEYVDRERDSWDNGPSYHISDKTNERDKQ